MMSWGTASETGWYDKWLMGMLKPEYGVPK